jgi:type IV pilus assembly protein PilM
MAEKIYAFKALGLELYDSVQLKAAMVAKLRGKAHIVELTNFRFEEPSKSSELHVNPLYLTEEEKAFLQIAQKSLLVSAIDAQETLIRPLEIKLKKEKNIDEVLLFQTEPLLPYPIDNAIVDRITIQKKQDGTDLTVLAVRKDHLQRHLLQWQPFEIEPEVTTAVPVALMAFGKYVIPTCPHYFVLHMGNRETCCVAVKDGKLIAAQACAFNLSQLKTIFLQEQTAPVTDTDNFFKSFHWETLDAKSYPNTARAVTDFQQEIQRSVYSLVRQVKALEVPPLLITGEIAALPELNKILLKDFQNLLQKPETDQIDGFSFEELQTHAIPIGAGLTALPGELDQINFRQNDFAYPNPWRRLVKPVLAYLAAVVLLTLGVYAFGQAYLRNRENAVRSEYATLLKVINKPYAEMELEIANKGRKQPLTSPPLDIPGINSLSLNDIQSRTEIIRKQLQAAPDLFPLQPNHPRVSDLLAWLAQHPKVIDGEMPQGSAPLIELDSFNYSIVKRPDLNKKQERYQVKIEMEFEAANSRAAREFHEALLSPNPFIDPKGDVKWTTSKGKYKATFFLKDKTVYP